MKPFFCCCLVCRIHVTLFIQSSGFFCRRSSPVSTAIISPNSAMKGSSILLLSTLTILLMSNVFSTSSGFSSVEVKLHDASVLPQTSLNPVMRVKLHDAATLPCNQACSGRVTWTVFHKPHDILAQCNQTSCQSEEGFHMSHDQYLKGDFSLTITDTDYTKRTWYTCECDDVEICDVIIRIEPVNIFTHVRPGESLIMDVPISQPVEVILNRTGGTKPNTVRLCEIRGSEIQCLSEYKNRVLFSSSLKLKEMKISDSGVYTMWDTRNDRVIATYSVKVGVLLQASLNPVMRVKRHDAATLPCNQTCSGRVTWTVFYKPHDILAQCDQTSCRAKDGFHMSHDQYLKGDFSLTITDVDYIKRAWYTCECDGKTLCHWNLEVRDPLLSSKFHILPGESLTLDVPGSEPVEVLVNKTDHDPPVTVRLCVVKGRKIECFSEYEKRVSFSSSLQLKEVKESDSGVYTIRDTRNEEVIATYTVITATVEGRQEEPDTKTYMLKVVLPLVLLGLAVIVIVTVIVWFRRTKLFTDSEGLNCLRMNPQQNEQIQQQEMHEISPADFILYTPPRAKPSHHPRGVHLTTIHGLKHSCYTHSYNVVMPSSNGTVSLYP